ncbi:MAG: S8 family serine peptidase [Acidobacteria bacterium]|nr:S8 family serine peptidase [Acidobacteriota bacterium]
MRRNRLRRLAGTVASLSFSLVLLAGLFSGPRLSAQVGTQAYVVRLRDDAVIAHLRRQPAYLTRRMNLQDAEAALYRSQILAQHQRIRRRIETLSSAEVREHLDTVFNGFAVRLRPEDVAAVENLPEVAEVIPSVLYHKVLDAAGPLVQLPAAWSDPSIGGEPNAGAGIKIGVIDTGIDIAHPTFQDATLTPPAGYPRFTLPTTECPRSDQLFTNSKVIVARNYVSLLSNLDFNCDAMDRDGHGTFVSGVAAGRRVQAPLASIAGVAPKAFLGSYKVFGTPGINDNATLEAIMKAIDDATKDGMDIINVSLGAEISLPPSVDPLAQAVAAAVNAGVTVVVAAGNTGPATGTITSPGTSPAAITVGSTTNSRILAHPLLVSGAVPVPPELQLVAAVISNGPAITADVGPAQLTDIVTVDASSSACAALPAASFTGRIALIRRGGCSFATKISNARLAGAIAVIIYNNQFQQPPISMEVGTANQIPSVMIGNTEGSALASYLAAAGASTTGKLGAQQQAVPTAPHRLASFSAAGPSTDLGIKPDLVAPGANIYSSEQRNFPAGAQYHVTGFGSASGTSFSSPFVAGAAALVKQASPGFTPAEVKSALAQTGTNVITPFSGGVSGLLAFGNGLMDVAAALNTPATVSPISISLGTNPPGSSLSRTTSLSIQNVSGITDTFALSQTAGINSAPVSLNFTPANITIAAGATSTVSIQITSSQPITGTVEGFVALQSQNTGRALTIPYWGNFLLPTISTNGVVNAASFVSGPPRVAAGSLVSIFGNQMTDGATASAASIPLPTSLAGIRVLIGGEEAPLLFVSPSQINAQVPQEVAGRAFTTVQVLLNGVTSAAALLTLGPTGPGIFAVNQAGTGRGAVLHSVSHREVTSSDPAKPGEILEVYANGLGATTPAVATGQAASSNPLSTVTILPLATLGNIPATVHFAGLAPSFVALYQVNIEVPANASVGDVPLFLISNGVPSNPVTVSIGR